MMENTATNGYVLDHDQLFSIFLSLLNQSSYRLHVIQSIGSAVTWYIISVHLTS